MARKPSAAVETPRVPKRSRKPSEAAPTNGTHASAQALVVSNLLIDKLKSELVVVSTADKAIEVLKDDARLMRVTDALTSFARQDAEDLEASAPFGELCYNFLKLPLGVQGQLTAAMAKQVGVAAPVYATGKGRPTTGRNELAQVIYHATPNALKIPEGQKDSPAAKRITEHMGRYKKIAGLTVTKAKADKPKPWFSRTMKTAFVELWGAVVSDAEQQLLVTIYERKGVTIEALDKLVEKVEAMSNVAAVA